MADDALSPAGELMIGAALDWPSGDPERVAQWPVPPNPAKSIERRKGTGHVWLGNLSGRPIWTLSGEHTAGTCGRLFPDLLPGRPRLLDVVNGADTQLRLRQLLDYPREGMSTEIKDWLDLEERTVRANVARGLLALANHGGGYLLFGFRDLATGWEPSGSCPFDIARYSQDSINGILKRHAEPPFECFVHYIASSRGTEHVVVEVPGGHTVPIRSDHAPEGSLLRDHTYYIRRPGPESAPPQNGREWGDLISRCLDNDHGRQVESFRRILDVMRSEPGFLADLTSAARTGEALAEWQQQSRRRASRPEDST